MRSNKSTLFVRFLIVLFLVFLAANADAKKRDTKTLVLDNGLAALLIHDPDVHRSAAALSVGTGQIYDPEEKMGLAHYLEHMLFLGTKKFPEVGEFKEYLNKNSGGSNAYTGENVTNYFFQVSHEAFEGAIDRFSDFFKEPLFTKKYSEREVNAVSSEHDKNKRNDRWRIGQIVNLIAEEGHPIRKFGTGNKETLAGDNRPALLEFYDKYYSATNMKVAMLSNLSLEAQANLVRKYFSGIPNSRVEYPPISPDYRKPLQNKYRLLKVKSIKDIRSLKLEFPTIRLKDHQESKPANIVASVIGHEGKGSLLSKLKEEGLALGLSAGGGYGHPEINAFNISISLTKEGVAEYERVLELVFSFIHLLKEHGFEEYTFKENQTMAQIDFDYKDPDEGMGFAAGKAALMQDFKLEDVETLPYLYRKYDPAAYKAILDTLTPENMLVVLQTNSVETDKVEKYYGGEYSITRVGGAAFEKLNHPPQAAELRYPEKNPFIPHDQQLVEENPHLVRDDDLAKVYFKFDNKFKQPKAFMRLRIETPLVYDTVDHYARAKLYELSLQEGLNEIVYPIQLAGLSYDLSLIKEGVSLTVGGYTQRISDLVKLVANNLTVIKVDEQKFKNLKEAMLRALRNQKLASAIARGGYYNRLLWLKQHYDEDQMIAALEPVTLADVKTYANNLYHRVYITGVAHGNWTDDKVKEAVQLLLDEIKSKPFPEEERFVQKLEWLDDGENIRFSKQVQDTNNSISYALQIGHYDYPLQARLLMMSSIVESDFYLQMRTNQQLGYIVWSFNQRVEDDLFFKFVIQSATYSPFELQKRIDKWLTGSIALFENLSDEEFERHRESLIVSLEKKGDSIAEMLDEYYYLATKEKGNFEHKKQLIEAVKQLKKEDVVDAARKFFMDHKTPRLMVLMRSRDNKESIPPGVLTEVPSFKNRKKS